VTANAYSFLPWLRTGLSTRITEDPGKALRASIPVILRLTGDPVVGSIPITKDVKQVVQIYGPGDVVGVDSRAISRTEPRPWITNVEPNYLAHIEFYDEDFPWRYSPAAPDPSTGRLAPWLALIVLAGGHEPQDDPDAEFAESAAAGGPLPFITVLDPLKTLPMAAQLGAWAHVHVNGALDSPIVSENMPAALGALQAVLRTNADNACSRLICPRRLQPDRGYHAFLVPAFETGRLAGLGLDPAKAPGALHPSWGQPYAGQGAAGQLPYYHRWFFGTGAAGDFEYLVEILEPREPDARVARRDVDVHNSAGPGLPGITEPAELGGVLRLGGALQIPLHPRDIWDNWDHDDEQPPGVPYPHPFQVALAGLINLADDYLDEPPAAAHAGLHALRVAAGATVQVAAEETDPVITPPLYGRWHARTSRLLFARDGTPIPPPVNRNWVHRLNLDPRFRIAANFGTGVVQQRQEEFMAAAWAQVGEVRAANARIRAAQLAREVGHALQTKHLEPPSAADMADSDADPQVPSGRALRLTAPASSRVTAPVSASTGMLAVGAKLAAGMAGLAANVAVEYQVAESRVASAPVSPAMRRITRPGSRLMRSMTFPGGHPADTLLGRMDADADPVAAAGPKTTPSGLVTAEELDEVLHPGPPPQGDPVDNLPTSANFRISLPEEGFVAASGGQDSPDAANFKAGLRDLYRAFDAAGLGAQTGERPRLDVAAANLVMLSGLRSDQTVPKNVLGSVRVPERLQHFAEQFIEVMAYPVIDLPMYRSLLDLSVDVFVPNLNLIPANTITLLETNQEFIESYMMGLNHEFARELLWREYPTDQRGTPFRQFWDPRTALARPGEDAGARRERLYDIPPIDEWKVATRLGEHDNREQGGPQENDLVLVIRGELLKKYPTAAIYAHKAVWGLDENKQEDPSLERDLAALPDEQHPSPALVKLPLYEAKVEPDIYLLGFDLTAEQALGHVPDDPGWFFVIKERPGDPRFGADIDQNVNVEVWNDLSWPDLAGDKGFIQFEKDVSLAPFDGSDDDPEKQQQRVEDSALPLWYVNLSSADVAYMLFQAPVLMAVHAQEMLPDA
jgi:hypothetical protein